MNFQIKKIIASLKSIHSFFSFSIEILHQFLVMCGKDHMDVHLSFSAPFDGIVSSKGMRKKYSFIIHYFSLSKA